MNAARLAFASVVALSVVAFAACGGSGGTGGGGTTDTGVGGSSIGGAAGASGKSGAAGKSGASGTGGASGKGGVAGLGGAAGKAGASGAAGVAGKAGAAGASGAAGKSGAAGASGSAGMCAAPKQTCGASCTDVSTDPKNCGKCGAACPVPANGAATCAMGKCGSSCSAGFGDCDGSPANGCETATGVDPKNCGKCANVCPSGGGAAAQCAAGTCGLVCAAGTSDCDKNPANGCEADTANDANNCGTCGMKCGSGACVMGACGCAATTQTAELLPLDLYIIQDKSGSMTETTATGATKWDGLKAAMSAFLSDPMSNGLGVGIQYFPEDSASVPPSCTTNAECGALGPCAAIKACTNSVGTITVCQAKSDCAGLPPPGQCQPIGLCSLNQNYACFPSQSPLCGVDAMGNDLGACVAQPAFCQNQACDVATYATPAVGIAPLPANAGPIDASLNATMPSGGTPTTPALQGAIQYASSWATMNPTHTVVVILATDGLPNDCSSTVQGVAAQAAMGNAATPRIRTFVIGIFTDADIQAGASANADTIALAGGGQSSAFIVQTGMDVTAQLVAALNKIRQSTLSCDYKVPVPATGMLDPNKVNVVFTDPTGTKQTILYVGSAAGCDPVKGGWYYDDPVAPTKITVCKTTCDSFQTGAGAKVDIELGCATIKP